MSVIQKIALSILIVGGLNWGLIGFFDFNLVAFLFDGMTPVISRIVYALVGVASITTLVGWLLPVEEEDYDREKSYQNSLSH
jgi:uncharacterized membrane protein YuzA (DUF378 family)